MQLISPNFSDLLTPNIEIGRFPDGDSHVRIPQIKECKSKEVFVFHRLYPKQNSSLVELFLILESLKEEGAKVNVVVPYLPYARQDKKKLDGEVASAIVLSGILKKMGCDKLITFDCHFLNATGEADFAGLKIQNISMGNELVTFARKYFAGEDFVIVAPDSGANYLVKDQGGKSFKKVRQEYKDGKVGYRDIETMECDFEIKEKNILILDDMISTGSTMINALEKCKESGTKKVCAAATHGLFLYNSVDKLKKYTDCVFSTDTIAGPNTLVSIKEKLENLGKEPSPTLF